MSSGARAYTIIVQRDGALGSRTLRLPVWALRTGVGGAIGLGILLLAALALYGPVLRAAARVPGLQREVARLRVENAKIMELSTAVDSLEQRYAQVRRMMGADLVPD